MREKVKGKNISVEGDGIHIEERCLLKLKALKAAPLQSINKT
jgi:hypothetical protein